MVEVTETRPFPGGTDLVVAKVQPAKIQKMAPHPDVITAEAFHPIVPPVPLTPKEEGVDVEVEAVQAAITFTQSATVLENLVSKYLFNKAEEGQVQP